MRSPRAKLIMENNIEECTLDSAVILSAYS
jgi:hypothetical protein